ncbi:tetratricopeptide repeat protein [Hyphomicrobium sp. CS1GBMeth3]|uniref:tetratricopeptide repeat protein n=1 Tax=Hyphomicrobium sp. CS1GBMeth3 TaxID=1892845 RepID=UPI0009FAFF1B|nr:tetratricopeptide repeat protein [Hyphomicrobium sp. CS1GBMeth3]
MTRYPLSRRAGALTLIALTTVLLLPADVRSQTPPEAAPPAPKAVPRPEGRPAEKAPPEQPPVVQSPEQHAKLLDELYTRLATAPDETTANQIANAIEQLWQHSGSATADLLVARAVAAAEAENRALAMKLLNAAVELQPDFTEAWSRRAYLYYMDNDYKRALGDLRRVLALDPRHFKALEGLGNLLQQLGEKKAALEAYEAVLKVHPHLPDARKARDDLNVEIDGQGI